MINNSPIQNVYAKVKSLAREVCDREGCRLYDLEFVGAGKRRVLRVYIDKDQNQVSIDDCANVSRGLSLMLDIEDVISGGPYELEVSSPGLERTLKELWHFEQAVGQSVSITLNNPLPGTTHNNVKGVLIDIHSLKEHSWDEDDVTLSIQCQGQSKSVLISLKNIKKAQTLFEITKNDKRGKNGR